MMSEAKADGSCGLLYYSIGDTYRQKGILSLGSLKLHMPEVPIQVHTDMPELFEGQATTTIQETARYDKSLRIRLMKESPFERTVFIDSDTFVVRAFFDLFELLSTKELALAPTFTIPRIGQEKIPEAFIGFNSGIFAYRKTVATMTIMEKWEELFVELRQIDPHIGDESPLRRVLYEQPVDMAVLSSHYNFRIAQPQVVNDPQRIRILHGHTDDYKPIINQLRSGSNPLFYKPS